MLFRSNRSIRAKLALLIAASLGAAVFLSFAVSSYRELARFGEAKRSELQATAEVFAASVADAVAADDRSAAFQALNAIGRVPGLRFAEIRRIDGSLFVESGTGVALDTDMPAGDQAETSVWTMLARASFYLTADVIKAGERIGEVGLLVDTSELYERLKQALLAAALSASGAVLVGILIAFRLQRSITGPLGHLAAAMNRVRTTSDFTHKAERHSDDETGQLVDAFNDMLEQIRHRDSELDDHRRGLENEVEERTRDLAAARDSAESANRAKSDFLATMSHEIRTPMNGMLVMAELLAGTDLPVRQQRYAETIVRSGQTLLTIINDILDLSKIEAGKLDLEQGRVPVATLVEDVLGLFWERAASKGLDLAAEIAPDVPTIIEADPVRLSQVLSNLVNNALKFTGTGHVKVRVERRPGQSADTVELLFAVHDTGIGIEEDKVGHIFEAFSQADQSTTRRYGGTGLGLSICQRLVAAMNGRIWVESVPGQGSTFSFTMQGRVLNEAAARRNTGPRTALVALEGEATRSVLTGALAALGYAVRSPAGEADMGLADIVFANAEWIEKTQARNAAPARNDTVICVAGVGNGKVDRLVASGLAQGILSQPVSSAAVRVIVDAVEAGRLADLLEIRAVTPAADLLDLSGVNVLVADDSPVNREVVTEALRRLKARTSAVKDGVQAVDAVRNGGFDIVLMDCSMPEMDGFAATRAIRAYEAEHGLKRTPVVALTAHVAGSAADDWQDAGMDSYLTKPFTMRSLADCLAQWAPGKAGRAAAEPPPASVVIPDAAEPIADPLDPAVLKSLRDIAGGSNAMLDKIFRIFQSHAPARLAALDEAADAGDLGRIASEAHALKSPCLNIGALALGAICAEIEAAARSGDAAATAGPTLQRLHSEYDAVIDAIGRECAAMNPINAPAPLAASGR